MTLREKVKQEDPHCVDPKFEGGVAGCPNDYGYLNTDVDFTSDECYKTEEPLDCEECWNKEFKEQAEWKDNIMHRFMRVV